MTTYKLVPVEPTEEMMDAGYDTTRRADGYPQFADAGFSLGHACSIYCAMLAAAPTQPAEVQGEVWRSHGREDTMRHPEESDVSGGATDCVPVVQGDALDEAMRMIDVACMRAILANKKDTEPAHADAEGAVAALRAHLAPIVADAERWRNREVQAEPVAWQPITTAPDGVRVLLGPRDAPVVGVVCKAPDWSENQEPTCRVVHYNGNTLVSNYRCSEWAHLHATAPAPCVDRAALGKHVRQRIDHAAGAMSRVMSAFDLEGYCPDFERSLGGLRALQANDDLAATKEQP